MPKEVILNEAIVGRLNERTGKSFSARLPATMRQIKARWREGFRLKDFEQVIDIKAAKWGADPKLQDYLRPKKLFGTNFEAYLSEARASPTANSGPAMFGRAGMAAMTAIKAAKEMM